MNNRNFWGNGKVNTGSLIIGAVVLIVILLVMMSIARITYSLLSLVALPLLVITAIIDYKIIVNYVNWIVKLVRQNTLAGIGVGVLSVVFYPVVAAILFGRAFFTWRMKKAMKQQAEYPQEEQGKIGEYIDFEDITPPKRTKIKQTRSSSTENEYDELF